MSNNTILPKSPHKVQFDDFLTTSENEMDTMRNFNVDNVLRPRDSNCSPYLETPCFNNSPEKPYTRNHVLK